MTFLLALTLTLSLVACGGSSQPNAPGDTDDLSNNDGADTDADLDEVFEMLYGKVSNIVGNEIELALANPPAEDDAQDDSGLVPVELPGGILVTQKEPINVESMEYTGESLTFTLPAGTKFYSSGQETTLSAVTKGAVVSVIVDNLENMNIQSVEILG